MIPNWVLSIIWYLIEKLFGIARDEIAKAEAIQAIKDQAAKDEEQLEQAKTEEEKTNAATAINHDTFGTH